MIKAEEISEIIKRQLQGYEAEIDLQEAGRVIEVGDGIARIYGLEKRAWPASCWSSRRRRSASCSTSRRTTSAPCCLGDDTLIKEGDHRHAHDAHRRRCRSARRSIGRVVNALGQPVDGKGPIATTEFRPIERYAPGVVRPPVGQGAAPDRASRPSTP